MVTLGNLEQEMEEKEQEMAEREQEMEWVMVVPQLSHSHHHYCKLLQPQSQHLWRLDLSPLKTWC